jgi:hypothetical protein
LHSQIVNNEKLEIPLTFNLTWPTTSMVLHGERTRKLRSLGPFELVPPINHFRKGSITPAMSRIDVKVFSRIKAAT